MTAQARAEMFVLWMHGLKSLEGKAGGESGIRTHDTR